MPIMSIYDAENSEWREIPSLKGRPASIEVGKVTTLADNDFAYVKNTEDALDIVHDAIVKALQKINLYYSRQCRE